MANQPQVNLKDVAKALSEQSNKAPDPKAPKTFEFSLPDDAAEFAATGGKVELPELDLPPDPTTDTEAPTRRKLAQWVFNDANNEAISGEVSEEEKDLYIKSMLFELPTVFDVGLFNDQLQVKVRSLSELEIDIVNEAVKLEELEYRSIHKPDPSFQMFSLYSTWYQRFMAAMRVIEYRTKDKTNKMELPPENQDVASASSQLRTHARKVFGSMPPSLYLALLTAVRVHEMKFTTCARKAHSRNFWLPVGTN